MEVHYRRDLESNYLILTDRSGREENYEDRMLTENRIYGLLSCVKQRHGDWEEYYYEITGRQSILLLYERKMIGWDDLQAFLKDLNRILETSREYLLNPDHVILEPEYIYQNARTKKVSLCYYPGYEKNIRSSFLTLAEFLLEKLMKEDSRVIEFGYELYQSAMEPNFSLPELLKKYRQEEPVVVPVPVITETEPKQEENLHKAGGWKNLFQKKPKKTSIEDYVAEADKISSGSVLFLKEQGIQEETACLQKIKKEGLLLKCCSQDYPDFQINSELFLIGKQRESVDGCIPLPTVSRLHARITRNGEVYYLEDLNSTNGTWADRIQLNPYELFMLRNGMKIVFASVEYEVCL